MGYKREEVFEKTLEYFNGDTLATNVWIDKYCLKNNGVFYELTPEDMHRRLAKEFARIESKYKNPLTEEEIFDLFKNFKYIIPQGSPMAGIGNNFVATSISNCFVIGNENIKDSYSTILRTDEEQVQLMKRRGGVGHDLSYIRPSGVKAGGTKLGENSGATLFMDRFSNSTREVQSDNRRGALMLSISVLHPDSEKFIDKKLVEGAVTGANISVKTTDEFIKSALSNSDFIQRFPINLDITDLKTEELEYDTLVDFNGGYVKKIKAKKIWDKIVYNAWKSAEPGCLFWDKIVEESPARGYGEKWKETSTNPCFGGNEKLLTNQGYKTFEELSDLDGVKIINSVGNIVDTKVWKTGEKETIKLKNTIGGEFICTPDHKWMLIDGSECEAKDLKGKKILPFIKQTNNFDELFVKLGFIQGDGGLTRLNSETHRGFEINIGDDDSDVLEFFGYVKENPNQRKWYVNEFFDICKNLEFDAKELPNRCLPRTFKNWSDKEKISFIRGLFSANGCVINNSRISFKTTSMGLIEELTEYFKSLNLSTYYTTNKSKNVEFSNGVYTTKESYDLNISKFDDVLYFYNNIGFIHNYKNEKLVQLIKYRTPSIRTIKEVGVESVYDFVEPENHWGVVNGYITHNCGEIPLNPYDSCRLLVINLYSYVKDKFSKNPSFDFDLFKKHTVIAQRLMDDIVDLEIEKIDKILEKINSGLEPEEFKKVELNLWSKIRENALLGRRTGFGIISEGDMLAAMNLTYGTKEATEFSVLVHKILATEAYKSTVTMAKERGSFKEWSEVKDFESEFIKRMFYSEESLIDIETLNDYKKYGRRNISLLTCAPTGSVGILCQTTSGIEPLFSPWYFRRKKTEDKTKSVYTDEVGDMWEEFAVFHRPFIEWFQTYSNLETFKEAENILTTKKETELTEIFKKSPYYKGTAQDVDYLEKVRMQGAVNKFIDHSISCTVNCPSTTTVETIGDIYKTAWESGCKGVTVYVDGSRGGILNTKKTVAQAEKFDYISAVKRPKSVEHDVYFKTVAKQDFLIFVGIIDCKPYEIFALPYDETLSELKHCKKGKITKVKSRTYKFVSENGFIIENIIDKMNETERNQTRDYSTMLRHRINPKYILEQIKSYATISSFQKVIGKILEKYVEKCESDNKCPECGGKISYSEGCLKCLDCGYAKCG